MTARRRCDFVDALHLLDIDPGVICTAERNNAAVFAALPTSACAQSAGGTAGPDHISQLAYDLAGQKLTGVTVTLGLR